MDELKEYAASLSATVQETTTEAAVSRALRTPRATHVPLRTRFATVTLAVVSFFSANVGLAAASQNAAPGDLLYGVDRAYERVAAFVGISDSNTDERVREANKLADRGDATAALAAASTALEALNSSLDRSGETADLDLAHDIETASETMQTATLPEQSNAPEFVDDVLLETRVLLDLVAQIREAAKNGEPGDAAELARQIRDQAQRVSDRASDKANPPTEPPGQEKPKKNQ